MAPSGDLVARGRAAVRRRRLAVAGAVAAVLVVGTVVVTAGPGRHPSPPPPAEHPRSLQDLPTGMPPRVPYFSGLDLVTTEGRQTRVRNHPRLMLAGDRVVYAGAGSPGIEFSRFDGTRKDAVDGSDHTNGVTDPVSASADGHWVASAYYGSTPPVQVQLFDMTTLRPVAIASFDTPANVCCSAFSIAGIDNGGSIYALGSAAGAQSRVTYWRWDRDTGRMTRLRGLGGTIQSVRGNGDLVVQRIAGGTTRDVLGSVDRSGTFHASTSVTGAMATWSPAGDRVVYAPERGPLAVLVRAGGQTTRMRLPTDIRVRTLVWEDDTELLLRVADRDGLGWVLRCRATDGRCEIAVRESGTGTTLPVRP